MIMGATFRERPASFAEALRLASDLLARNPALVRRDLVQSEAELIVCAAHRKATGKPLRRSDLYLRLGDRFPDAAGDVVIEFAVARSEGRLLQHLLGYQSFGEHEYRVSPQVLVPRPETEVLLEEVRREARGALLGLEIGVGSGVLSIELLAANPALRMIATDVSSGALEVARENAHQILGPLWQQRLHLVQCPANEVVQPLAAVLGSLRADFLVSNPPYLDPLRRGDEVEQEVAEQEPWSALFAPEGDPVFFYRQMARDAAAVLKKPSAGVFLEIPHERDRLIAELFESEGWSVMLSPDLTGRPRVLRAFKPSEVGRDG